MEDKVKLLKILKRLNDNIESLRNVLNDHEHTQDGRICIPTGCVDQKYSSERYENIYEDDMMEAIAQLSEGLIEIQKEAEEEEKQNGSK